MGDRATHGQHTCGAAALGEDLRASHDVTICNTIPPQKVQPGHRRRQHKGNTDGEDVVKNNARQSSAASLSSHSAAAAEEERKCAADLEMVAGWNVDQLKQYLDEFNRKISGKLSILRSRVVETRKNGRLLEKYCNTPLRARLDDAIVAWRHRREHE